MSIDKIKGRTKVSTSNIPLDSEKEESKFSSLKCALRVIEYSSLHLGLVMEGKLIKYNGEPEYVYVNKRDLNNSSSDRVKNGVLCDDYLTATNESQPDGKPRLIDLEVRLLASGPVDEAKLYGNAACWTISNMSPKVDTYGIARVYVKSLNPLNGVFEETYRDGLAKALFSVMTTDFTTVRSSYISVPSWNLFVHALDDKGEVVAGAARFIKLGIGNEIIEKGKSDPLAVKKIEVTCGNSMLNYLIANAEASNGVRSASNGIRTFNVQPRISYQFKSNLIDLLAESMVVKVPGYNVSNRNDVFNTIKDYLTYLFVNDYTGTDINIPVDGEVSNHRILKGYLTKSMIEAALVAYEREFLTVQELKDVEISENGSLSDSQFWRPSGTIASTLSDHDQRLFSHDVGLNDEVLGIIDARSKYLKQKDERCHFLTDNSKLGLSKLEIMAAEVVWHVYNHFCAANGNTNKVNFHDEGIVPITMQFARMDSFAFESNLQQMDQRRVPFPIGKGLGGDPEATGPVYADDLSESYHNQLMVMLRSFQVQVNASLPELVERTAYDLDKIIRAKLNAGLSNGEVWSGPGKYEFDRGGVTLDSFGDNTQAFSFNLKGNKIQIKDESAIQATFMRVRHTYLPIRKCIISRCEGKELRNGLNIA